MAADSCAAISVRLYRCNRWGGPLHHGGVLVPMKWDCIDAGVILVMALMAAWGTSVVSSAIHGQWPMMLLALFVWPAGVVHGLGVWVGAW